MDYFGDLIYVIDMLLYKSRLMFMENGFWVKNKRRLTRKYVTEGKNKCTAWWVETVQDFLIKLGIKPLKYAYIENKHFFTK